MKKKTRPFKIVSFKPKTPSTAFMTPRPSLFENFPTTYQPQEVDSKWYSFWEERGYFCPSGDAKAPSFSLSMPPPNVTGVLHMGHALGATLSDISIRYKRMKGFNTLWLPGTDHAGIATQTRVERHLIQTLGKRRKDFSREEFLKHVWDWKDKNEHIIVNQLKKLGCSCDWSKQRFTMDEASNKRVKKIFKKLYDEKLIYRGNYLVNWDPLTQTALADDEVEYEEKDSFLWFFHYPLKDAEGHLTIATTRPETLLGDVALAVNPKDPRYQSLIGKQALLPIKNRPLPILADPFVDPEFGTGVVKITPAHDPNDYQMGLKHQLPIINIMTPDGKVNEQGAPFEGLSFEEARKAVVEKMQHLGLLEKTLPHTLRVGKSYRSKAIIEPYMSKQWFVNMAPFKPLLKEAIEKQQVTLFPPSWKNTYMHWIDNLRDWCISRQLWWGHRIPIWYHKQDPEKQICYDGEGLPYEVSQNPEAYFQDEDVLDTWFSSAFWPFNIVDWEEDKPSLFYPNSLMITGHDILFFWVARMLAMGKHVTQSYPFPQVFLHGLIFGKSYWRKDKLGAIQYVGEEEKKAFDLNPSSVPKEVFSKWEKMSKSKGNIIDPLEIIEQYGTDAMRMALCASNPQLSQIDLDRRKFEEFKNFTNKVWNGSRFVLMNLEEFPLEKLFTPLKLQHVEDKWILSVLSKSIQGVEEHIHSCQYEQAATKAYDFFWKDFCAYYVEMCKPFLFGKLGTREDKEQKQQILMIVWLASIRLLHPMAPFITEELFQRALKLFPLNSFKNAPTTPLLNDLYKAFKAPSCMLAPYPFSDPESIDENAESAFQTLQNTLYTLRNIRGEMNIPPSEATEVYVIGQSSSSAYTLLKSYAPLLQHLIKIKSFTFQSQAPHLPLASSAPMQEVQLIIPLPEALKKQEVQRLKKERLKLSEKLEKLKLKLSNPDFLQRAPEDLVAKQQALLTTQSKELQQLENKLNTLTE